MRIKPQESLTRRGPKTSTFWLRIYYMQFSLVLSQTCKAYKRGDS